jgi:hypothetical protein
MINVTMIKIIPIAIHIFCQSGTIWVFLFVYKLFVIISNVEINGV